MRDLFRLLALTSGLALASCGADINAKVSCTNDDDCLKAAGLDTDASFMTIPQCCASVCVIPATGCDSSYRYITVAHAPGDCAPVPMCTPRPDMSTVEDLSDTD